MIILTLLGLVGFFGMSWLFPIATRLFAKKTRDEQSSLPLPSTIAILIPVHNDSICLRRTLQSISAAASNAKLLQPELQVSIVVGADGCTDETEQIAREFGAACVSSSQNKGKWNTLLDLISYSSSASWIVLADCGVLWEDDFLLRVMPECAKSNIVAIAPTYYNSNGSVIEKLLWSLERHFKTLEDAVGGPISIHGATVLYRTPELLSALQNLKPGRWLNDDVVIPLIMRSLNPALSVRYLPKVAVHDSDGKPKSREFARRKRLVLGNVQWINTLFPIAVHSNLTAAVIALRRIFRVFWAYWILMLGIAAVGYGVEIAKFFPFVAASISIGVAALLVVALGKSYKLRRIVQSLLDSALASMLAPFYILTFKPAQEARWK